MAWNKMASEAHVAQRVVRGTGSPEGSVTADVGVLYERSDGGAGTSLYVKQSGSGDTGWTAMGAGGGGGGPIATVPADVSAGQLVTWGADSSALGESDVRVSGSDLYVPSGPVSLNDGTEGGVDLHGFTTLYNGDFDFGTNLALRLGAVELSKVFPGAPAFGRLRLYSNGLKIAPRVLDERSNDYALQPSLLEKTFFLMTPNATTSALYAGSAGTSAGTLTTVAPATVGSALFPLCTNFSTGTTANTAAGVRMTNNAFRHAAMGGFWMGVIAGLPDTSYDQSGSTTGSRIFVGMSDQTSMVGSDNPSGNYAGFMRNHVNGGYQHANWQFATKNNTTLTVVDTGLAFIPRNMYYFQVYSISGQSGYIYWQITNMTTGDVQNGVATSTLPGTAVNIGPVAQIVNVNAVARSLRVAKMYCEN